MPVSIPFAQLAVREIKKIQSRRHLLLRVDAFGYRFEWRVAKGGFHRGYDQGYEQGWQARGVHDEEQERRQAARPILAALPPARRDA